MFNMKMWGLAYGTQKCANRQDPMMIFFERSENTTHWLKEAKMSRPNIVHYEGNTVTWKSQMRFVVLSNLIKSRYILM